MITVTADHVKALAVVARDNGVIAPGVAIGHAVNPFEWDPVFVAAFEQPQQVLEANAAAWRAEITRISRERVSRLMTEQDVDRLAELEAIAADERTEDEDVERDELRDKLLTIRQVVAHARALHKRITDGELDVPLQINWPG